VIVRSLPAGRSFKWLAEYLVHDPKAETTRRVAWTHTVNLAHDDIGSAVGRTHFFMFYTASMFARIVYDAGQRERGFAMARDSLAALQEAADRDDLHVVHAAIQFAKILHAEGRAEEVREICDKYDFSEVESLADHRIGWAALPD
jgi:hypothetical protein